MRRRTVLGVDLSRGAGYEGTSPVGAFPPNGYGLYDMIGNVWESTTDWYVPKHPNEVIKACCTPHNPRGPGEDESYDPCQPKSASRAR
jgi:formylglycine-generating enzyme